MSCINESNINIVLNKLIKISKKYSKFELSAENFRKQILPNNENFIGLKLKENTELKKLHSEVMNSLQRYLAYDSSKIMFINSKEINNTTINWVNSWGNKHNDNNSYNPHLSIGIGKLINYKFPIKFEVKKNCNMSIRKLLYL